MPIFITRANYEAVARSHLRSGEALESFHGSLRAVVALTDQRLLVSDFPWTGPASLIFEAPLSGLEAIRVDTLGDAGRRISATVAGLSREADLPASYASILEEPVSRLAKRVAERGGTLSAPVDDAPRCVATVDCRNCGASVTVSDELAKLDARSPETAPGAHAPTSCAFCGHGVVVPVNQRGGQTVRLTLRLSAAEVVRTSAVVYALQAKLVNRGAEVAVRRDPRPRKPRCHHGALCAAGRRPDHELIERCGVASRGPWTEVAGGGVGRVGNTHEPSAVQGDAQVVSMSSHRQQLPNTGHDGCRVALQDTCGSTEHGGQAHLLSADVDVGDVEVGIVLQPEDDTARAPLGLDLAARRELEVTGPKRPGERQRWLVRAARRLVHEGTAAGGLHVVLETPLTRDRHRGSQAELLRMNGVLGERPLAPTTIV